MTLALLLTAVTGAWAQSYEAKVFDVPASWTGDETRISAADLPKDFVQITKDEAKALAVPDGTVVLVYGFVGENVLMMAFENGTAMPDDEDDDGAPEVRAMFIVFKTSFNATICYPTPAGPKVAWDAATKTGTFAMPGSDVVLTPIYAKAAAFATTGTEPEVKTLLPEAAEGVIAGTDASLIAEGTGIVAFAGTSTEDTQGTLMYAIGTSATEAPALTAFSATVPTAENVADDGATVYVWYYIQGADAPEGVAATLDNTFDNTEPACLTVQVLTNKFDIQFNAANANTLEAGKATVTVGGTAATVTEGKLQGVKMGSEVKVKANTGYKFRKVEVKKAGPAADIVWDGTNVSDLHVEGNYLSYTKEGIKLSGNAEQVQAEWNNSAYLGTPGMEFITMESGGFTFTAPTGKAFTKIEMKAVGDGGWATENLGTGWAYNTGTVTWTGSAASTVKLLKDADMFSGDFISSIAFYLSE